MSEIIEFYRGKNILITGAAGFLGRLLMERLLRICEIGQIFIIVRDKNGLRAEDRHDSIFNTPVFDRLRQLKPSFLNSVKLVKGDIGLPGLGLSDSVRAILVEEIDVVFHSAATVSFNEPIRRATLNNVRGTKEIVLLCQEMKHLKALVHVSTAYSNFPNAEINEEFYDPPVTADELINFCERLDDGDLSITTKKFLEGWPDTYVFTKCVAEEAVKTHSVGIPTCIFRPAVIICTKREPIEGWIDNYYGPSGLISSVESGFARFARADIDTNADFVPADMCVNVIMSAAHKIGKSGFDGKMEIFNFASSSQNNITWRQFVSYLKEAGKCHPSAKAVWNPSLTLLKSKLLCSILSFIYHLIPAFLVDMGLLICRKRPAFDGEMKIFNLASPSLEVAEALCSQLGGESYVPHPLGILVKRLAKTRALETSRKLSKFLKLSANFSCKYWKFSNENVNALWNGLNPTDKVLFDFDLSKIDWKEMINIKVRGTRKYLFKEDEKTIPMARKRRFWLLVIDRTIHGILIVLMSMLILKLIF